MIGYVMVGTQDLLKAKTFYEPLFKAMGGKLLMSSERSLFFGRNMREPLFGVGYPYDGQSASVGNGGMCAFVMDSPDEVDDLHARALELGARSEGDPGERSSGFYAAYCRDPDGNKLAFYHHR